MEENKQKRKRCVPSLRRLCFSTKKAKKCFGNYMERPQPTTTPLRETVMRSSTGLTDRSASYLSVWRATEHESRLGALDEVCVFAHFLVRCTCPAKTTKHVHSAAP